MSSFAVGISIQKKGLSGREGRESLEGGGDPPVTCLSFQSSIISTAPKAPNKVQITMKRENEKDRQKKLKHKK